MFKYKEMYNNIKINPNFADAHKCYLISHYGNNLKLNYILRINNDKFWKIRVQLFTFICAKRTVMMFKR